MTNYLEQYFTPPELTRALLERLKLKPMRIAEPCIGDGWISRELTRDGHQVRGGDLDPQYSPAHGGAVDFFSKRASDRYRECGGIITNPPWSCAARFARRALEFTPNVAMLLRLTFLEPCESTSDAARVDLLHKLTACIVLPRVSFIRGKAGTDSVCPAWFIWGFEWCDLPMLDVVTSAELARHAGQRALFIDHASYDDRTILNCGKCKFSGPINPGEEHECNNWRKL